MPIYHTKYIFEYHISILEIILLKADISVFAQAQVNVMER